LQRGNVAILYEGVSCVSSGVDVVDADHSAVRVGVDEPVVVAGETAQT